MSGHSKWSTIKHKKGAADAKRGKLFTKVIKEIMIASRMGGGDPAANPRLRSAMQSARDVNMPKDNIEKAIKKGTGEMEGVSYEDFTFEGYGPGGVALLVEGTTDNRNRTTAEVRHTFGKYHGNMGETGCVAWMFEKKGIILVLADGGDEDSMLEKALEAGADDMESDDEMFQIMVAPTDLEAVRQALESQGVQVESASVQSVPQNTVAVEGKEAERLLKLISAMEDQDDVSSVSANFDIEDAVIEQFAG